MHGKRLFATIKYESEKSSLNLSDRVSIILFLILFVTLCINLYYYFSLGKKLSKIGNEVVSKFSKFAYTTAISFVIIILLAFMSEDYSTAFIIVETIVSAVPLLYLIIGFNNSKEQVRFV